MSARQRSVLLMVGFSMLLVFLFGGFSISCGKVAEEETGFCGDHTCSGAEDCTTCVRDCGVCADACGDLVCGPSETCSTCPDDCGDCSGAYCANGTCDPKETCGTCARDCGSCADNCGDGACTGGESCNTCNADCGQCVELCGNGIDDDFDNKVDEGNCQGAHY